MVNGDYIFIGVLIIAALIGYFLGFGRSLKMATKGLFGALISIFVCFMFGGVIKNIAFVNEQIQKIEIYLTDFWDFLKYLHLGTVVYYVCLFLIVQLLRIIIIKIMCSLTEIDNRGVKVVNKILGAVFLTGFCFGLCLLGLSGLKLIENTDFALDILVKLEDGLLWDLYKNNPIVL